jgi:hypothetical protein
MDHKLAETSQSVEKYTLNELSPGEREQFEEHMFDCPVCSDLVRQNFIVLENLKEVLQEAPLQQRVTWRDWLRVPSLVPTFAALALACVLGYQNFASGPAETMQVLPQMAALKATSRGTVPVVEVSSKAKYFVLPVNADQLSAGPFACQLDHATASIKGQKLPEVALIQIQLPTKNLSAGRHTLVLRSDANPADPITYTFEVQDSK